MSGSGTSWEPTPPRIACDRVALKTVVNSPVPAVIGTVQPGDCLEVQLQIHGGRSIVVVLKGAAVLGSITVSAVPRLVECLENGHSFKATVLSVSGARCEVEIRSGTCP